jgi:hypothetical protein
VAAAHCPVFLQVPLELLEPSDLACVDARHRPIGFDNGARKALRPASLLWMRFIVSMMHSPTCIFWEVNA